MDASDKSNIEKFIYSPERCTGLVMLKEFWNCEVPKDCPWKKVLKKLYEQDEKLQQEKDSGLI